MSVGKKIKLVFVLRHFVVSMITRKCLQLYCVRKKIYMFQSKLNRWNALVVKCSEWFHYAFSNAANVRLVFCGRCLQSVDDNQPAYGKLRQDDYLHWFLIGKLQQ